MQNQPTARSIWFDEATGFPVAIDQRRLPFHYETLELRTCKDAADAISKMVVRGAPLIGVTAAYGMYLAAREKIPEAEACEQLMATRPTAVNLAWALSRQLKHYPKGPARLLEEAHAIAAEDIAFCSAIGDHGLPVIQEVYKKRQSTVNILTHCNAGWLATVQWGTATAPMYKAHHAGIPIHVWVDETRPRNQGARLTSWELARAGVPHTVIADNTGGHLMQHGKVDLVLVGSDRTTSDGDVCNKIGTYLKALAAYDNQVPFYAALPVSTIDWDLTDGLRSIPIEERSADEMTTMEVQFAGKTGVARLMAEGTPVANYAFDVTPARLVTGLITERGICEASREGIAALYHRNTP